jgi:hypothetical protein
VTTLETLRPSIAHQDYLDRLYDMGIFDKKLDVWAYCASYALGKGLTPEDNSGSQMGSDLVHLDSAMLDTLRAAVLSKSDRKLSDEDLVKALSKYASVGIAKIRQQTEGKTRTEIYEFLLGQVEV